MFSLDSLARLLRLRDVTSPTRLFLSCILAFLVISSVAAEDASIDRLLSKLPAPEKIVKPSAPHPPQQKDPALQDPLFVQIFALAGLGNFSEGRLYSRKLAEKYPRSEAALILWGEFAYRLRYYDEAAVVFRRATVLAPHNAYAWLELTKAENALGQIGAALNAMAKAAEISPRDGELAAVLGFSYINLNRIPQAIPALQRAAKLLPQDYLVQSQLGYCFLVTGQNNTAIGYLQKGASLNTKYGPVWEHLGVAYQKQGRNRDAVSALENATRLLPSSGLAWRHLAEAYQATGRNSDAQRATARAQQLGGVNAKPSKKA